VDLAIAIANAYTPPPEIKPSFPLWLDSTMLSTYKSCAFKFFLEYVLNFKPREKSVHLIAGGAFAAGLEASRTAFYVDGKPAAEAEGMGIIALLADYGAFECPADSAKSPERMAGALEFYFDRYPLGGDGADPITLPGGRRGIEVSFAEPLPIHNPDNGDPLLYCGRLDMAAKYAQGLFVEDDKTTSSLGATWSRQWDLRSQFTGYCWGLWKAAGIKPNGVLVRGVSILKTKYDTQQAISYRHDWQIEEWEQSTLSTIEDMIRDYKRGYWRQDLDHACAEYGGCHFKQTCMTKGEGKQNWLEQYYQRRLWNPVTRQETKL
jgi:hypothetical protein